MIIPKKDDLFSFKVNDLEVHFTSLSQMQRIEAVSNRKMSKGADATDYAAISLVYLKNCVKAISGIKCFDGSDYQLEFDGDKLTDECADELLALDVHNNLIFAANAVLEGKLSFSNDEIAIEYKGKSPKK